MQTVRDLAAYSVRQEASLAVCDARRAAVVAIIDVVQQPKPRKKLLGVF